MVKQGNNYLNKTKILIKIGSGVITENNKLDTDFLKNKAKEIAELIKEGKRIILVSSGAVAMGMESEDLDIRPGDVLKLQLLSGKGQAKLMSEYIKHFNEYKVQAAQILLTQNNFKNEREIANLRSIINGYLSQGDLPIINANDVITNEELTDSKYNVFSDNDELATVVATKLGVDMVIILTDVDGLYTDNPYKDKNAELIRCVNDVSEDIIEKAKKETGKTGLGGMLSKVMAAKELMKSGIITIIANGECNIKDIIEDKVNRTVFDKKD